MIIYNPQNILPERIKQAEDILQKIPAKYCFITGSFLYNKKYKDIDVFILSRTKKEINISNPKIKITLIDFNDLYSLFYHSLSNSCIAKNILPQKALKVTLSDYWNIINEAIPTILNQKEKYHKAIRFLILYTEYFKTKKILNSFQLSQKIKSFNNYREVIEYVKTEVPSIFKKKATPSYLKRFFYTQSAVYKDLLYYDAHRFLYELAHFIARRYSYG